MNLRPFPQVGDRVREFWGPRNPNNWACAGEVRAVLDDEVIVVRRWNPYKRFHRWVIISQYEWTISAIHHLPKSGEAIPLPEAHRHLDGVPMEGPPQW
jgi:hypothetical protein